MEKEPFKSEIWHSLRYASLRFQTLKMIAYLLNLQSKNSYYDYEKDGWSFEDNFLPFIR